MCGKQVGHMGLLSDAFTGWHLLIIALLILVLFGAAKLPIFAKNLGRSVKIFRTEIADLNKTVPQEQASKEAASKTP